MAYYNNYRRGRRRYSRSGYGRRYGRRSGGYTRKSYVRNVFVGGSKTKRAVRWLTIGLVVVGLLAIVKPASLKSVMQKIGLKTA